MLLFGIHPVESEIVDWAVNSEEREDGSTKHICAIVAEEKRYVSRRAVGGNDAELLDVGKAGNEAAANFDVRILLEFDVRQLERDAGKKDSVDPTFEDAGYVEPPRRIDEDERVALSKFVHRGPNVGTRDRVGRKIGMRGRRSHVSASLVGSQSGREIILAVSVVQRKIDNFVPCLFESSTNGASERAGERGRWQRVGMDQQNSVFLGRGRSRRWRNEALRDLVQEDQWIVHLLLCTSLHLHKIC